MAAHPSLSRQSSGVSNTAASQYSIQETIKIYTDWANHYLEKGRCGRRVESLQRDLSDGVLLAYIVQAVTNKELAGINYNPKNSTHMLNNITSSIEFLRQIGVNVEELTAKDIKDGNLKSVLGLFFNLSRYKQQLKQAKQDSSVDHDMSSRIPGSGLRAPSSSTTSLKKLSAPSFNGKGVPVITSNKKSGLIPPGQRQSTGSSVSSRSTSPVHSSIPPPGTSSKLVVASNGRTTSRRDNSNSNNSTSSGRSMQYASGAGKSQVPPSSTNGQTSPSPGMLDKLFKSKKSSATPKSKLDDAKTSTTSKKDASTSKKDKSSSKTTKKEESKISKPPLSSIPRGGSLSSRSRTPSRENLAKCRIQPPATTVTKPANRLSSDSGIHSPADTKPESRESGLVRNNSLPSSRIHSVKDSGLNRHTALRSATNSPVVSKKEQRSLPKALLSYSKSDDPAQSKSTNAAPRANSTGLPRTGSSNSNKSDSINGHKLKIPPPLPSSLPPPSSSQSTIYNQIPGVSHYIKPSKATTGTQYQSKDDINQARKMQQQASKVKVESDTQTDPSALQKIAQNLESRKSTPKTASSKLSGGGGGSGVHILPGQKTSQAKIMSLTGKFKPESGTDSSNSSLGRNSSASSNDSVIHRPGGGEKGSAPTNDSSLLKLAKDCEKSDDGTADFLVEPMQPLDKLASHEFLQRLGRSTGGTHPTQSAFRSPLSSFHDKANDRVYLNMFGQMNRSFNTKSSNRNIHEDYASDAECYSNGYLSDAGTSRASDYADYSGYLSEGGTSIYARRMQQRFKEGMQLVQECLTNSKYQNIDDDSFDEDDASSVSSGDISDTLDLVDTQDACNDDLTSQGSGSFFDDFRSSSTPYRQPQNSMPVESMRDRNGSRAGFGLTRSTMANGYTSDSGCNYSITEKCMAEQQRAKGLISSKTQQSLAAGNKQDDLYKSHTLGRSKNLSAQDPRSYALLSGPVGHMTGGGHLAPNNYARVSGCADTSAGSQQPLWIMQNMVNRRSLGSESDGGPERSTMSPMMSGCRSMSTSSSKARQGRHTHGQPQMYHHGSSTMQHNMMANSVANSLYSHIHQGGYESDSGVMERRSVCSQCCQPINKESDMLGSQLSLSSTSSSMYSTAEERQAVETQKLRKELELAKDQVFTLTSQLTTNAHVVQAFEQSLGNMTLRLQQLQSKSEQKDSELSDMKSTIDNLRRMTGLAHTDILHTTQHQALNLHTSPAQNQALERQMSADSISSLNSMSSISSGASSDAKKKVKKSWIRNSFSKAFGGKKKPGGSMSDVEGDNISQFSDTSVGGVSAPTTPLHAPRNVTNMASFLYTADVEEMSPEAISEMKRMLREKEMKLTDIRLDALTSAHQLEQLRDVMGRMKQEMHYLKADNDRLHRMVGDGTAPAIPPLSPGSPLSTRPSISSGMSLLSTSFSQVSSPTASLTSPVHRASFGSSEKTGLDFLSSSGLAEGDGGKRVTVSVVSEDNKQGTGCFIGSVSVTGKTKWDVLDSLVKRTFKQYLSRIDQSTNLGLTSESIYAFIVGEVCRVKDGEVPELLPYGYLVGDTTNIKITLKGAEHNSVDSLAFETGIPKSIIQRYASLLSEHKRIILSGPTGTGKSHLAQHLAGYLLARSGKPKRSHSVAIFDGEHKSSKELRDYLCSIQDQCENCDVETLPLVIILDNLHHVSSLGDVFSGFLSHKSAKCPYIIGTMNQTSNATTNLQLHHNFRWVLCANHMEPVKGFLGRYLRRKLVATEVSNNTINNDLVQIIQWIPKVWQHVNKFIETHNCTDATIGPRQFLDCPMDVNTSQSWFTQLWNYSLVPYLKEAVKEGLQTYGQRSTWEDPADWLIQTYPWSLDTADLLHLRAEDVGYDSKLPVNSGSNSKQTSSSCSKDSNTSRDVDASTRDPLYNMIIRLREASTYNETESLESHSSAILDTA
ncbi:neuron navigator 3-like isoform X2 [Watersipora subatra]|uniref:neuron navigator 3-like isoform X2 n=1 Tax=Watersipora subatra TaxID=2589382 RepID=UPI00355B45C2